MLTCLTVTQASMCGSRPRSPLRGQPTVLPSLTAICAKSSSFAFITFSPTHVLAYTRTRMHLLMEPIDVAGLTTPTAFCWKGFLYEVDCVLESWTARGEWWGKEERREYFMLLTQRGVMEIFKGNEGWVLSRIVD